MGLPLRGVRDTAGMCGGVASGGRFAGAAVQAGIVLRDRQQCLRELLLLLTTIPRALQLVALDGSGPIGEWFRSQVLAGRARCAARKRSSSAAGTRSGAAGVSPRRTACSVPTLILRRVVAGPSRSRLAASRIRSSCNRPSLSPVALSAVKQRQGTNRSHGAGWLARTGPSGSWDSSRAYET
jgi:hypothetical protein